MRHCRMGIGAGGGVNKRKATSISAPPVLTAAVWRCAIVTCGRVPAAAAEACALELVPFRPDTVFLPSDACPKTALAWQSRRSGSRSAQASAF